MVPQLPSNPNQNSTLKILIIDDDEEDILIVQEMLKEARGRKFDLHWQKTYAGGRTALFSDEYHAVLVDYDLGTHSGIELIREASGRGFAAPLILFTGRGSYEVDVEAMEAGATLYLSKGEATPLLLERVIRYAVELKQKEQSLRASEAHLRASEAHLRASEAHLRTSEAQHRQAEQARVKAEERFAKAFHSSPAALAITSASDGRYIEANESLCQLLGYQRHEIIGHSALELGMYANPAQRAELLGLLAERGNVRDYEIAVRTKSGSQRTLLGSIDRVELDHEPCLLATLIDITDRKLAEQALVKSESRLRQFMENTHDSYFSLDQAWSITYANRKFAETMGISAQEIIGKNFWALYPQYLGTDVEQIYRKTMAERAPFDFRRFGIYTNRIYDISVYPTEEGIAIFSIDRTDEYHHQQQLENERAQLATVLSALPVGVWITDMNGRIVGKNDQSDRIWAGNVPMSESMAQYSEYEMLDPASRKPRPLEEYPLVRVLSTGQPVEPQENLIRRFDNSYSFAVVSAAPINGRNGQLTGAVAIMMDINERKQEEEMLAHYAAQLARSNQELERFAFVASHDLQEPLRKIVMFGNSLQQRAQAVLDERSVEYLERIQRAAERMQTMINGLLALSQINWQGREFQPADLSQVVEEVVSDLETRIKAADGRVEVSGLPVIAADELQMRQLFQNLVGNAIKFQRPGVPPLVQVVGSIDQSRKPAVVEIRVRDNGIGFDPQHSERIFQPFQRLHGRNEYEGTGLGLSICQKIVERHNGKIWAQSEPGIGTTLIVQLPL